MGTWYRRDWDVALEDVRALSAEEHRAYDIVVLLIHKRGGAVPDDEGFVAGWCRCEPQVWRRIRARLIDLGKLYESKGGLRSRLADAEVAETRRRHASAQAAGRAAALARASASSEIKHLGSAPVADVPLVPAPPEIADTLARAQAEADAEIDAHLDDTTPYAAQDMVAGLMEALGHVTAVSPPGPDGGTDILGYRDPLGRPCLRAQVKHRVAPVAREDIAALRGILQPGETGLFVSFSTFSPDARREAQHGTPIRLIDRAEFVALWIRHYAALPESARDHMRLKPVHFLERRSTSSRPSAKRESRDPYSRWLDGAMPA
jgi:uncharacterized protein YdaU (DUF1376 family)